MLCKTNYLLWSAAIYWNWEGSSKVSCYSYTGPSTVVPARQFHGILPVPSELSERPRAGRSGHTRTYVIGRVLAKIQKYWVQKYKLQKKRGHIRTYILGRVLTEIQKWSQTFLHRLTIKWSELKSPQRQLANLLWWTDFNTRGGWYVILKPWCKSDQISMTLVDTKGFITSIASRWSSDLGDKREEVSLTLPEIYHEPSLNINVSGWAALHCRYQKAP